MVVFKYFNETKLRAHTDMIKVFLILVCFIVVVKASANCGWVWCCLGGCDLEETTTVRSEDKTSQPLGLPISAGEMKDGETLEVTEPDHDPTQNDKENFEGDIKGLDAPTLKGYAKDAAEIQLHFEKLKEVDPDGHMDISSLHLDGDIWLNAIKSKHGLWPKVERNTHIPYWISSSFTSKERKVIAAAMGDFHKNTCIRFVWRTHEEDFISIQRLGGCWSYVGRQIGSQQLSLGSRCVHKGIVMHELMHAAGLWHEQSRTDRDSYVTIYYNNIYNGMRHNFEKYGTDKIAHLGTRYDYNSIMHYHKDAFSKNGRPTIVPRKNTKIGQRSQLSSNDILKLNRLYQCSTRHPCRNKRSWCNYYWINEYCFCGWIQQFCPKVCGLC